jgi:hypothetical protein
MRAQSVYPEELQLLAGAVDTVLPAQDRFGALVDHNRGGSIAVQLTLIVHGEGPKP